MSESLIWPDLQKLCLIFNVESHGRCIVEGLVALLISAVMPSSLLGFFHHLRHGLLAESRQFWAILILQTMQEPLNKLNSALGKWGPSQMGSDVFNRI